MRRSSGDRDRPKSERERIATRLDDLIKLHGYNYKSLEGRMQRGRGYVGEAIRGGKRLTVELILEVLGTLGEPSEEIFTKPRPPRGWRTADEVAEPGAGANVESLPATVREASLLVKALVLELTESGVIRLEDLQARLEGLAGPPPPSGPNPRR